MRKNKKLIIYTVITGIIFILCPIAIESLLNLLKEKYIIVNPENIFIPISLALLSFILFTITKKSEEFKLWFLIWVWAIILGAFFLTTNIVAEAIGSREPQSFLNFSNSFKIYLIVFACFSYLTLGVLPEAFKHQDRILLTFVFCMLLFLIWFFLYKDRFDTSFLKQFIWGCIFCGYGIVTKHLYYFARK